MFNDADILKWKELRNALTNDGYIVSGMANHTLLFYSQNESFRFTFKNGFNVSSNAHKQSIIDILCFLTDKHYRLKYWDDINWSITYLLKELDIALLDFEDDDENTVVNNTDKVNHPKHYTTASIECIDLMQELYGTEAVKYFCKCNALKYLYRADNKNGLEDIKKAAWYLNKIVEMSKK